MIHTQRDNKLLLDDVDLEVKDIKEENKFLKNRIDSIEQNLPKMIRELIDYYTE